MNTWLEVAQNLPCGHSERVDCDNCGVGTNTNAAICNHNPKYYSVHCYACDYNDYSSKGQLTLAERQRIQELNDEAIKGQNSRVIALPDDTTYNHAEFSREARMWLYAGGVSPSLWTKYSIGYSKRLERVVLPVYRDGKLIWYQCRAILKGQRPKYIQPSGDRATVMFSSTQPYKDNHLERTYERKIVVEDILSAIRVGNAGVQAEAVSLLGTKITAGQTSILSQADEVVTWLDGDKAGKKGSYSIRKTLSLLCDVSNIRTDEDPKAYSNKQIREILT